MRAITTAFLFLFTLSLGAEEITVDAVLAAHNFGAPAEKIIAKINNPANTVGAIGAAETGRLRAAGISEEVIAALALKAGTSPAKAAPAATLAAVPAGPTSQPDNPNLTILVKAVKAGTSESLLADQIKSTGVLQRPSMNDVLYLKENGVSEAVIKALMEAPLLSQAGMAARQGGVPQMLEVDGLVMKKALFSKNLSGKMVFTAEKMQWLDGTNQANNFDMFPAGLKAVQTTCSARADGKFCHEIEFQMTKGSDFNFVDAKMDVGGNEAIMNAVKAVKTFYPKLPIVEKIK
jgi:hypothetical protein